MNDIRRDSKKQLMVSAVFLTALFVQGCDNKEDGEKHLQKGIEYLNQGEYEKAKLELETSSQSSKDTAQTYYYLALLDEKNQHYKTMKENLLKTIELSPNHTEARIKLGNVLLLLGEPAKAQEQADYLLKQDGQNLQAQILSATALISQKKNQDALVILDGVLAKDPNHAEALSLKSMIFIEKNDLNTALELIDKALKSEPQNIAIHLFKIQIYAKSKNMDAVIQEYKKLMAMFPDNKDFKVMLAKIYSQMEKKEQAEELLRQLVAEFPDDIRPKLLLLDFMYQFFRDKIADQAQQFAVQLKGDSKKSLELAEWMANHKYYEGANKVLDQVIATEKKSNIGYAAKAQMAKNILDAKDYSAAGKIIEEILANKPDFDKAKILRARLLLGTQLPDEAIEILNKLSFAKPNSDEVVYLLGQAYLLKDNKPEADKYFAKALELNPTNFDALVFVYDKAVASNDIKFAKDILKKALRFKSDNLVLLEKLAKINISERNWEEAKAVVQQIDNVINPLSKDLSTFLQAQIEQGQGEYAKAIDIYKGLLAKFPENSDALVGLGRSYEGLGKRGEMIGYLTEAMAKNPRNFSAGVLLAELYGLDRNFIKGMALLQQLIDKEPRIIKLYVMMANMKLAGNDRPGAVAVYEEGLGKNPENVELSLSLASLYESQGQHDSAIKLYRQLVEKNPRLDVAINNLASILGDNATDKGQLEEAARLAERFKDSDRAYFKDTYAWILLKQEKITDSLALFEQIVATEPDVPTFRYHLAVAYHKSGNDGLANSELKQSLELAKSKGGFPEQKAAENLLAEIGKSGH